MPDDYLTVDEVAAQLAVPLEMIQRRIESGDIPVHWVEVSGKLEMRISAAEIGVESAGSVSTPFPTPETFAGGETHPADEDSVAAGWSVRESQYPSDVWTPADGETPVAAANIPAAPANTPAAAGEPPTPWAVDSESDLPAAEVVGPAEPVWRPEPATWDDEPLQAGEAAAPPPEPPAYTAEGTDSFFPLDEAPPYVAPPPPAASDAFAAPAGAEDEDEEEAAFGTDEEDEDGAVPFGERLDLQPSLSSDVLEGPEMVEVPRPSALAAAPGTASALAVNSIDARELVAGLFERWERALEQRIQAEQRLRFEAELERRLRQVRDLRQELENTRKSTAAQLAEREQEVLALRNRIREQPPAPKGRGLFRR